jgi:hypothetical protein
MRTTAAAMKTCSLSRRAPAGDAYFTKRLGREELRHRVMAAVTIVQVHAATDAMAGTRAWKAV